MNTSDTFDRLPIIKAWNQVLVPLQGQITDAVAERLLEQVLEAIQASNAEGLIIDLTGVWMVDSHLCSVLSKMAASARLMGAESIMCGMSAEIAITLQTMGIDLVGVRTVLSLEEAFSSLGIGKLSGTERASAGDKTLLEALARTRQRTSTT